MDISYSNVDEFDFIIPQALTTENKVAEAQVRFSNLVIR
jgi:hypothetical protein